MKIACNCLITLIVTCLVFLQPHFSSAASWDYSGNSVTETTPVVYKSAEEEIPVRTETKVSGWTWVVLALLAAGGGAALAMGGGGKGDSSSSQTPAGTSSTTGNTTIHW